MQKINQILNKTIEVQQSKTLYLYLVTDSDNKYN